MLLPAKLPKPGRVRIRRLKGPLSTKDRKQKWKQKHFLRKCSYEPVSVKLSRKQP